MKRAKPVYEEMVAHAKETSTPDKLRAVGVAWGGFNVTEGATDEASADLELNPDGTITKYDTYQELGQGSDIGSLMLPDIGLYFLEFCFHSLFTSRTNHRP